MEYSNALIVLVLFLFLVTPNIIQKNTLACSRMMMRLMMLVSSVATSRQFRGIY